MAAEAQEGRAGESAESPAVGPAPCAGRRDISLPVVRFLNLETDQAVRPPSTAAVSGMECNDGQPAAAVHGRRFEIQSDAVRDCLSGLVWTRCASLSEFPLTWDEAARFVESLNRRDFNGVDSWRLPARDELFSLISHCKINPALPPGHPFTEVFNGYYWTATTCARLHEQAWYVHLGGGRVQRGMKHGSYMVWPVSSTPVAEDLPPVRFVTRGPLVEDRWAGRVWLLESSALNTPVDWQGALAAVEGFNARGIGGSDDWRLPTIRELDSITDVRRHSPAVAAGFPADGLPEGLWSATTSAYEPSYAWVLYCKDGAIGVGHKPRNDFSHVGVRPLD